MPKLAFRIARTVLICLLMTPFLSLCDIPSPVLSFRETQLYLSLCLQEIQGRLGETDLSGGKCSTTKAGGKNVK